MKKIVCLFLCSFLFIQLFLINNTVKAVTAYPFPIEFTQPDGSKITIRLKGDEKVRWAETMDGYSIMFNKTGTYEYAILDNEKNMVPSGIQVKSEALRSIEETNFLKTIPKGIKYSSAQVQMMKSAWNVYTTESQKAFPTTGDRKLICILIGFTDVPFTKTNADFYNLFNQINYTVGGATGSVKDYYLENSYNQLNLTTTVVGPYTASHEMAYYGADNGSNHSPKARELVTEAIYAANSTVNYADFDNDGNGSVDGVHVIFAGYGQEAGGSADAIWSHKSSIYPSVTLDGKTISTYSCSPELRFNYDDYITRIGVICHEFGHVLGAPDFYDTDYTTGGQYDGTGEWDLMADGSWNDGGRTPAHHNAYTKTKIYNWATSTLLNTASQITLDNAAEYSNSFYQYNTNTSNEYFLIENRQKIKFDAFIPGHGMIVYHVDGNYISSSYGINAGSHQGMYPVCANASGTPPTTYGTINSGGCPFPGTGAKTSFTDSTTPNSKSWANVSTAKPITNITENNINKTVSFAFMGGYSCSLTTIQASNLTYTSVTTNSITLNCTRGNGNRLLVIAKEGLYVNANLSLGTSYVADTVFGSGQEIGTGNFVVYNGSGSSVTITGLSTGTVYYFACYEYNTAENCYLLPALTGSRVTNYNLPVAAGAISGASNVCIGQSNVTYTVPPIAYATYYIWTLPSGISGFSTSNSISVSILSSAVSGNITVTGNNPTGSGALSTIAVTVNPIPTTPTITQNGNILTSDVSSGNQWYMQTITTPLSTSNTYSPSETGTYYVVVTENGCQSAPSNNILYVYTGIAENNTNSMDVEIYPNPFTEKTTIKYVLTEDEVVELSITNVTGQELTKLFNQKQNKGEQSIVIDASKFSSGIYFYKLKAGNIQQKGKLIVN